MGLREHFSKVHTLQCKSLLLDAKFSVMLLIEKLESQVIIYNGWKMITITALKILIPFSANFASLASAFSLISRLMPT